MDKSLAKKEEEAARNSHLQLAIEHDDVDKLYSLIEGDEKLLDYGSEGPFPNTPLHHAADKGKIKVAMEIAILKPSFAQKLNRGGHSPMHLALQKKHYDIVRALMTLDPELIRVQGRGGITPLHFVAREKGDNERDSMELLELLAEFLFICKLSIEDLTSQCETAVHVAVKNRNTQAFEVLCGWLKRVDLIQILNWKDQNGDTVLHIAVSGELQPKIIKLLIEYTDVNAKNFRGMTALKILEDNHRGNEHVAKRLRRRERSTATISLSGFYRMELTGLEKYEFFFGFADETARDIILVVSTLIATATYQAALSPPGGYWQDSSSNPLANSTVATATISSGAGIEKLHQAGDIIMNGWSLYFFSVVNSMAFFTSIGTIWATAIPLLPRTNMVCIAMVILGTAFSYSLVSQFPKSEAVPANLLGGFYVSLVVAGLVVPLVVWRNHARIVNRIDATGRRVDTLLGSKSRKCGR